MRVLALRPPLRLLSFGRRRRASTVISKSVWLVCRQVHAYYSVSYRLEYLSLAPPGYPAVIIPTRDLAYYTICIVLELPVVYHSRHRSYHLLDVDYSRFHVLRIGGSVVWPDWLRFTIYRTTSHPRISNFTDLFSLAFFLVPYLELLPEIVFSFLNFFSNFSPFLIFMSSPALRSFPLYFFAFSLVRVFPEVFVLFVIHGHTPYIFGQISSHSWMAKTRHLCSCWQRIHSFLHHAYLSASLELRFVGLMDYLIKCGGTSVRT